MVSCYTYPMKHTKQPRSSFEGAGATLFLFVTAFFAFVWVALFGSYLKLFITHTRTTGYVTGFVYVTDPLHSWNKIEYGSIQYVDGQGRERFVTDKEDRSVRGYGVHDSVSVYYNPHQPEQARVSPLEGKAFPMSMLTLFVLVFTLIPVRLLKELAPIKTRIFSHLRSRQWLVSTLTLVIANSVPVFGVVYFGWSVFHLLLLYWMETIVIGFYTILRQFRISSFQALGPIVMFIMHFGFFLFLHFLFLTFVYGQDYRPHTIIPPVSVVAPIFLALRISIISLFLNHGIAFVKEVVGDYVDQKIDPFWMMMRPYGRIILLQVTLILGSFLIAHFQQPVLGLVLLISLKTLVEIALSLKREDISQVKAPSA